MNEDAERVIGGILLGAGFTAAVGLPPPWWPDMPPYLVHAGVISGFFAILLSMSFLVIGLCKYAPKREICKKVIAWWQQIWTVGRALGASVLAILFVCLGSAFWPAQPVAISRPSIASIQKNVGESASTIIHNAPVYNFNAPAVIPASPVLPSAENCPPGTAICINGGSDVTITNNYCGEGIATCLSATGTKNVKASGNITDPRGVLVPSGASSNPQNVPLKTPARQ